MVALKDATANDAWLTKTFQVSGGSGGVCTKLFHKKLHQKVCPEWHTLQ